MRFCAAITALALIAAAPAAAQNGTLGVGSPVGAEEYARLTLQYSTLPLTPDEVRAIGQRARSSEEVTLRDVSLTVGHGELVAIIGGSGSGKTTLLDAMSGLRPPSSGTVAPGTGASVSRQACPTRTISPVCSQSLWPAHS